jgi:hypothetical protein
MERVGARKLAIGCAINSVVDTDRDSFSVDTRFQKLRDSGVFDYAEKTPPTGELDAYLAASERFGVPLRTGSFFYVLGRDAVRMAYANL